MRSVGLDRFTVTALERYNWGFRARFTRRASDYCVDVLSPEEARLRRRPGYVNRRTCRLLADGRAVFIPTSMPLTSRVAQRLLAYTRRLSERPICHPATYPPEALRGREYQPGASS